MKFLTKLDISALITDEMYVRYSFFHNVSNEA